VKPKLIITGAILIVGVLIFLPDTIDLLPDQRTIVDSVKNDLGNMQASAAESVDNTIDNSVNSVNTKIDDIKQSSQEFLSDQIPPQFGENPFFEEFGKQAPSPELVERHGNPQIVIPSVITTPEIQTISFETLSLVTEKQDIV